MPLSSFATFRSDPLTTAYQQVLRDNQMWEPSCPVSLDRLRNVTVSYYDFDGCPHHNGHIIVLDAVAKRVITIFKSLYAKKFPIAAIKPLSDYHNDDDLSMQANNSSSFNCRPITGGSVPSIHAYGLAIDINPVQNPYVKSGKILPPRAIEYTKRQPKQPGMVEGLQQLFAANGFPVWGGHWHVPIDYQHFQPTRLVAQLLAHMKPQDAESFFALTIQYPKAVAKLTIDDYPKLAALYDRGGQVFDYRFLENIRAKTDNQRLDPLYQLYNLLLMMS